MNARRVLMSVLVAVICVSAVVAWVSRSDNTGGGPIPSQREGETYPGPRSQVTGTYDLDSKGCMLIVSDGARRLAVWPRGASQAHDDAAVVVLRDGTQIHRGDTITGEATVFPVAQLAGYPDGYWGSQVIFCVPNDSHVLVLDSVAVSGS